MTLPKRITTSTLAILFIILGFFFGCQQQSTTEAIEKTSHIVDTLMTSQDIPGIQIAVWKEGEVVFSRGFGYADLEHNLPMSPSTKLRIGSVSKTLTSAAVGKLYEGDKIDLAAPVQQYVSYYPEKRYPINVRQVAGHIAGIRHYRGEEFLMNKRFETVKEGVEIFDEDTLLFEPGTNYSYSSYGWNLISAVVEGAADTTFLSYMESEVFDPLEMDETVAEYTDSLITNRTSYYSEGENGKIINAPAVDNSYKWAGGGFIGTAEDLIVFGEQIFWGDFLEPETVDVLTESLELDSGDKTNYGIGWRTGTDEEGRRYYGHSGGSVGGTTQFVVFPEQKVIVAVVANIGGVSYHDSHLKIADFFIDGATNPS
jgi:CubicO group peptidase (beta-lactamase class C family)